MKFSTDKKGYNIDEVDSYVAKLNEVLANQKERVELLKQQVNEYEQKLNAYKEKTGLITKAIYNAVSKAEEIEKIAKIKSEQEMARLKVFHEKWIAYYNKIIKQYPLDEELKIVGEFNKKMSKVLSAKNDNDLYGDLTKVYETEKNRLGKKQVNYIADSYDDITDFTKNLSRENIVLDSSPIEKIKQYLQNETTQDSVKKETSATKQDDYSDRSPSGFSFSEALNPKDDLSQIMKDLGLLLE